MYCEISGSQGSKYEDNSLLEYNKTTWCYIPEGCVIFIVLCPQASKVQAVVLIVVMATVIKYYIVWLEK
jgi:hypothetical protein